MNMLATCVAIDTTQPIGIVDLDEIVKVELKASTLKRLLEAKYVCASDFHCLDCSSKQCIRELCLQACLGSVEM